MGDVRKEKNMEHDGCIGCKYEAESEDSKNCKGCRCTFLDKYSPRTIGHDGCVGCDYENQGRNNKNCKACKHNAIDKYVPREQE